jgi:hypothetical protein
MRKAAGFLGLSGTKSTSFRSKKSERGCLKGSGGVRGGVVAVGEIGPVGGIAVGGEALGLVTLVNEDALDDVEENEDAVDVENEDPVGV